MGLRRYVPGPVVTVAKRLTGRDKDDRYAVAVMRAVLRPDSSCVDIGAHKGAMLRHMVRLAPGGRHIAVEPLPTMAARLRERYPRVRIEQVALSNESGSHAFFEVQNHPDYSGLHERDLPAGPNRVLHLVVRTMTLDELAEPWVPYRFVKIDVEGGEADVLAGALHTLARCRPFVLFEHGRGAADKYPGFRRGQVYDVLVRAGLEVWLPEAWLRGRRTEGMSREEFLHWFDTNERYYFLAAPCTRAALQAEDQAA